MPYDHTFIDLVEPCACWHARYPSRDVARLRAAAGKPAVDATCRTPSTVSAVRTSDGTDTHYATAADYRARTS
jgi:hypothetical protein